MLQRIAVSLLIVCSLMPANEASASQVVLTSRAPYREVGVADDALSHLCALGRFGPAQLGALIARFVGPAGPGILDVAKGTGLNLLDRDHRAKPQEDYFFHDAGTTSCEVLVGGRHGPR